MSTLFAENNLAVLLHIRGRLREAEPLFRETMKLRREKLPADHPNLAEAPLPAKLGRTTPWDDHRPREAEAFLEEAISIYRKAFPAGHPSTALAEVRFGICLADLGHYEEAEPRLLQGYAALPPGKDTASIKRSKVRERIAKLYEAWGHPEKAAEWLAKTNESSPPIQTPNR